ncbi:hypothetical protein MPSYJ_11590 [Mycolicibacterium psychrotolerans]|uniref:DUF222 domain-containing protein n=1 Tax=Mycolicibacterium psychrotolerans TaxID=216929 RepID=A0A7I7M685_9MYCO|nr:hypothetical protein MPSYJ_11590 [Mycolicibacterium psychrotolerans]
MFAALDAADEAYRALADLPVHRLRPVDQRALLVRLDTMDKQLGALQRRLLGSVVAGPPPVEFAGAPWAQVLARRLRISVGEAQRRIAEAGGCEEAKSA